MTPEKWEETFNRAPSLPEDTKHQCQFIPIYNTEVVGECSRQIFSGAVYCTECGQIKIK